MHEGAKSTSNNQFSRKEQFRENAFEHVWTEQLDDAFADIARYYDTANYVASLGMWGWFRKCFLSVIDVQPGNRALDVCAGTNAIGIAMLEKQPNLDVHAIDRSEAMQRVGQRRANRKRFNITSTIGDVHELPFPDNHFDVATLQFASRHLKVIEVFREIQRVLKPGGHFYHCDMLRPSNPVIERLHYGYLKMCLASTALIFRSNEDARNLQKYFVDALSMFYAPGELSDLLREVGYQDVEAYTIFSGIVGYHKAIKPLSVDTLLGST